MALHALLANPLDVEFLISDLAPEDADEITKLGYGDVENAVRDTFARSDHRTMSLFDEDAALVAMFGVCPLTVIGKVGAPWVLTTTAYGRHNVREVAPIARTVVANMLREYNTLCNAVWADHPTAVGFVRALGFTLDGPYTHPTTGAEFYAFHKSNDGDADV